MNNEARPKFTGSCKKKTCTKHYVKINVIVVVVKYILADPTNKNLFQIPV